MNFIRSLTPTAWLMLGLAVVTVVGLIYADRHLGEGEDLGAEDDLSP